MNYGVEAGRLSGTRGETDMKAWVCRRYGGPEVLDLADVPKPTPGDNEILVRIHATTVTSGDWRVRSLTVPNGFGPVARLVLGITRPRQPILGSELSRVVEAAGKHVTAFARGDAVFAFPGAKLGCHAEYRIVAADGSVAMKPDNLSFEEAASLSFGGTTALHFLRKAGLTAGEKILVIGASGGVGTAIVQLAKHMGAEVTGVTSTVNVEFVASLGADKVIDYTNEDWAATGATWDVIADLVGATSFGRCRQALKDGGRFLAVAGGVADLLAALWTPAMGGKRVVAGPAEERPDDVRYLAGLAKSGALRAVIGRRYRFDQMAEAHAHVDTGRKRGSLVVSLV
jgi:NADPH:quinone reductase-like Zn-dependent oxidoreductase